MDGGSFSSSIGDSIDFDEKDLSLSDKLKVFKASAFDPDSYVTNRCRQMSEKVSFIIYIYTRKFKICVCICMYA